jgi:hypothetical protein
MEQPGRRRGFLRQQFLPWLDTSNPFWLQALRQWVVGVLPRPLQTSHRVILTFLPRSPQLRS